jgi:hypothetical protein
LLLLWRRLYMRALVERFSLLGSSFCICVSQVYWAGSAHGLTSTSACRSKTLFAAFMELSPWVLRTLVSAAVSLRFERSMMLEKSLNPRMVGREGLTLKSVMFLLMLFSSISAIALLRQSPSVWYLSSSSTALSSK